MASIEIPQIVKQSSLSIHQNAPGGMPMVSVIEIRDPTAVGEDIEVIKQDAVLLDLKPLRARCVLLRLGKSIVLFHSANLPLRTRTRLHNDCVAYTTFGSKVSSAVNGLPISPDHVLACTPRNDFT